MRNNKWTKVATFKDNDGRCGHRILWHEATGGFAIADNSGDLPEQTDKGACTMTIEQLIAHLQQQCRRHMQAEVCVEVYREGDGEVFVEPLKRWPEVQWVIRDPHLKTYTQDVSLDNCDAFPVLVLSATETQLKVDKVKEPKPEPDEEAQEEQ